MKKLVLLAALALSCAHSPEVQKHDGNYTRKFFCSEESCPAFAKVHNYTLLTTRYDADGRACVCRLQSDNMPDAFDVSIPIHAPADSPVDSL